VHTNNDYQIIFPPKTQWVTQHAKREYAKWPVADSIYNGIDFRKGVEVSWWKNHPSSISMFCVNDEEDFIAGYDHGKQAGTMHVADHHQAPGKKFFTWGTGPSGRMWNNILSDTDGPYLELMVGAWSDNQPDYSWMQPYEAKSVKQYWYPFRGIGGAKAMELAGITRKTADPPGGDLLRDAKGNPIGIFRETASRLLGPMRTKLPPVTPEQREARARREIELAAEECLKHGITSVHDAGVGSDTIERYKAMIDEGRLPVRIYAMLSAGNETIARDAARLMLLDYGHRHLTVRSIKRLIDGALGPRGAGVLDTYSDMP
jgi:hypothetical protein